MMARLGHGSTRAEPVALGVRVHSGWAALVAVTGTMRSPRVLDRRRIVLVEPGIPKQPYHTAENLPLKAATKLIGRSRACARLQARRAFRSVLSELKGKGHKAAGCGLLLASGRPLPGLAATLASHALIHTAEGELFREAIAHASRQCRLPVTAVKERELFAECGKKLRLSASELPRRLTDLGRALGPPWTQDEKFAALAAWLALAKR